MNVIKWRSKGINHFDIWAGDLDYTDIIRNIDNLIRWKNSIVVIHGTGKKMKDNKDGFKGQYIDYDTLLINIQRSETEILDSFQKSTSVASQSFFNL